MINQIFSEIKERIRRNKSQVLFLLSLAVLFLLVLIISSYEQSLKILFLIPIFLFLGLSFSIISKKVLPIKKLLSYIFITILLCISVILSRHYYIFGFSTLVFIFTLSGMGIAKLFSNQLPFRDIVGYLTNSLIFGIFVNIIGLQIIGILNIEYTDTFLTYFWIFLILINFLYCLLTPDKDENFRFPKFSKRNFIDLLWLTLFVLFFFVIVQICIEQFFPNWDSFTFWGVDAKYLYENRTLRDPSFLRLNGLSYSSAYTSLYFLTYVLLGGVYEQFASLITVLFSFLSFMLLFNRLRFLSNILVKNLAYLSIVFILTTFLTLQSILVSLYSDVFCSFLVLLFVIVLTQKNINIHDYYKRFLILSNIAFLFYLVKTPYLTVTIALLAIWLVADIFYFRNFLKKILYNKKFLLAFLFEATFIFFMWRYISSLIIGSYGDYLHQDIAPIRQYVAYAFTLLSHVSENIPLIFLLYGAFTIYFFVFLFKSRRMLLSSTVFLSVTFIPMGIFMYMFSNDFMSKSLIRYISLGFFLLPYIFMTVKLKNLNKIQTIFSSFASMFIGAICIYYIFFTYNLNFQIDLSSGSYIDAMPQHYILAEKVKGIAQEKIVTIVDQVDIGYVGDVGLPSIYVKYYMLYNNSKSSYKVPVESFFQFYKEYDSDYLLILEYDGYWQGCNSILEINNSYLIKKENIDFGNQSYCPVEKGITAL